MAGKNKSLYFAIVYRQLRFLRNLNPSQTLISKATYKMNTCTCSHCCLQHDYARQKYEKCQKNVKNVKKCQKNPNFSLILAAVSTVFA